MPTRVRIFKFMNSGENNIVKDFIDESGHSGQDLGEIAEKITFLNQQVTNRLGGLLHSVFDGVSSFLRSQDDILIRK
uniref:Uncharacterized protein n=1 Tax=Heterorhabditis bacteriophora TaxID=37862 RepID=A0A1I7XLP3_HETBA